MSKVRNLNSKYFQQVPLAALDYYEKNSHGEHDFSRRQAWFYSYGDREIEKDFNERLKDLFEAIFEEDDLDWDIITLYPTHSKGEVNPNLKALMLEISADSGIPMNQVLERTETVRENHVIEGPKAKAINLEGSVDVKGDVEGKNVILVDNIALSGSSLLHGAHLLRSNGARNVFAVALGTDRSYESETRELGGEETAEDILHDFQIRVVKG
jgi:phosphoribosylpyrophosphate synthetase